jgi:hypothetical protein
MRVLVMADYFFRGLLRRYAADRDPRLAQQIANTVLRTENVVPLSCWKGGKPLARPPQSIDEILSILTSDDIIPLGILAEWDDDHVACGKVAFIVEDKCLSMEFNYCGMKVLGAFEWADSPRARAFAIGKLRYYTGKIFDIDIDPTDEPDGQYSEYGQFDAGIIKEIRDTFEAGGYPRLGFGGLTTGYSRYGTGQLFQKHGQKAFEEAFGPLQPHTWAYPDKGTVENRWQHAHSLSITPEGSFWHYRTEVRGGADPARADYSRVVAKVPVGSPSLHEVVWRDELGRVPGNKGCFPFDDGNQW